MASSSSSSSSTSTVPWSLYDVFLSFSGSDTGNSFTSHLLDALNRQGFSTFRDDTKLQRGEDISSQLPRVISDSKVSIVVFSKNYAASGWCLDELVKIMECERDLKQIVLPIFYDVDPSDVRRQSNCYTEAFKKHEERFKGTSSMGRVMRWREALTQAANLSGWDLQNVVDRDEAKLIEIVIEEVTNRLDRLYVSVAEHPVGIDSRVRSLKSLLKLGLGDVSIVAVWGVGGIGKTTIAKAVLNSIRSESNDFESTSFLADVRETCKTPHGVVTLQKQLLSNILMNETYNLDNYHQGIKVIGQKLRHKKVLLVLDDVDHVRELKMLAINRDFFCKGSKIIITTRNKSALTSLLVDAFYSPEELNGSKGLVQWSNCYAEAFKKHEERFEGTCSMERVMRWREGLTQAGNLSGWDLQNDFDRKDISSQLPKAISSILSSSLYNSSYSLQSLHSTEMEYSYETISTCTTSDEETEYSYETLSSCTASDQNTENSMYRRTVRPPFKRIKHSNDQFDQVTSNRTSQ